MFILICALLFELSFIAASYWYAKFGSVWTFLVGSVVQPHVSLLMFTIMLGIIGMNEQSLSLGAVSGKVLGTFMFFCFGVTPFVLASGIMVVPITYLIFQNRFSSMTYPAEDRRLFHLGIVILGSSAVAAVLASGVALVFRNG